MSSFSDRFDLITRNVAEVVTKADLKKLLTKRRSLRGYIGVEPSGLFHVGWIMWALKLKDLMQAGVKMNLLEATWHAWINDKLNGSMENLQKCATYLEHCLAALDIDVKKLEIVRAEEVVKDANYWALVLRVAKQLTLARVKRSLTIMGRREREGAIDFSKLIYPSMQVSDIFYLDLDVCLGGTDQRRAHMLAREVAEKLSYKKPVAIHTPLLMGLSGLGRMDVSKVTEVELIDAKMSKSKPETCIFIHDSEESVRQKILDAFCPPRQVEHNPVIELNRWLLFSEPEFILHIKRPEKYGSPIEIPNFRALIKAYKAGEIHPLDLKNATAVALNKKLTPVREYFSKNAEANRLYKEMEKITITR